LTRLLFSARRYAIRHGAEYIFEVDDDALVLNGGNIPLKWVGLGEDAELTGVKKLRGRGGGQVGEGGDRGKGKRLTRLVNPHMLMGSSEKRSWARGVPPYLQQAGPTEVSLTPLINRRPHERKARSLPHVTLACVHSLIVATKSVLCLEALAHKRPMMKPIRVLGRVVPGGIAFFLALPNTKN
jgi:hypothetical protein